MDTKIKRSPVAASLNTDCTAKDLDNTRTVQPCRMQVNTEMT